MTSDFQKKNVAKMSFKVEIPEEGEILIFIKTSEIIRTKFVLNYEARYVRIKIISRSLGKNGQKCPNFDIYQN